ncbi:glycosyltransferase family 2 protein [Williamsia sterculiae]|uniref:Glycosyltransferase involved in cell wall bisynthesis n=1 Tax=Williamsia sterculiae TaxID=1344003 RepID=A0A1N7CLD3_9NOCA|nr:glycosyltransferase family 2 protein [Williamsia sterculiae]SIR64335.1 Glycosyltransferase involved in cell wall bisynthesis [Williamsia sterculiae]
MTDEVSVVIPCRDEAGALPGVIGAVPGGYAVVVVDNGSTDGTADVARSLGARVVVESVPGYGSAVHAGVLAAETPIVCTIDGDGSMDPADLVPMVAAVRDGADLAVGRRRALTSRVWPWHARLGSVIVATGLRIKYRDTIHDIGPMRVARTAALLELGVTDRRSGYPVELLVRAMNAGWRIREFDVAYRPRAAGRSKVSGSLRGSFIAATDFLTALRHVT